MFMDAGELALKKVEKIVDLVFPIPTGKPGGIEFYGTDVGRRETRTKRIRIPLPATRGGFRQSVQASQFLGYSVEELIHLISLVTNAQARPGE